MNRAQKRNDPDGLTNEQKLKINTEMKFLEQFLVVWDINKEHFKEGKMKFIQNFVDSIEAYEDLQKTGTDPQRAKFILLTSLKNSLIETYRGMNNGDVFIGRGDWARDVGSNEQIEN